MHRINDSGTQICKNLLKEIDAQTYNDPENPVKRGDPKIPKIYYETTAPYTLNIKNHTIEELIKRNQRHAREQTNLIMPEDRYQEKASWVHFNPEKMENLEKKKNTDRYIPGLKEINPIGNVDLDFNIYARRPKFDDITINAPRRMYEEEKKDEEKEIIYKQSRSKIEQEVLDIMKEEISSTTNTNKARLFLS